MPRMLAFFFLLSGCGPSATAVAPPRREPDPSSEVATTAAAEPPPTVAAAPAPTGPAAAALLGAGDPVSRAADPVDAPRLLAIGPESGAYLDDGVPRVWGDHPEHVPYAREDYGPITLDARAAVQLVLRGGSVTVLHADGTVTEVDQDERGGTRASVRVPPLRWIAGDGPVCGVGRRGDVRCWNGFANDDGPPRRARTIGGIRGAVRVANGAFSGVALLEDGTIRTFTASDGVPEGVAADGPFETNGDFLVAQPAITEVVEVAWAGWTACVLRADGTVWCWGEGLGDEPTSEVPRQLAGIDGVVSLHLGPRALCVRRRDESVACIGDTPAGLVTPGEVGGPYGSFVVAEPLRGATEIVIGDHHACWLPASRDAVSPESARPVRCVGANGLGELGVMPRRTAVLEVPDVRGARWLAASHEGTCAGGPEGAWCWPAVGDRGRAASPTPLAIAAPETIRAAWISAHATCVLRDGDVRECTEGGGEPTRLSAVSAIAGPCALLSTREIVCGAGATPAAAPPGPYAAIAARSTSDGTRVAALRADGRTIVAFDVSRVEGVWSVGDAETRTVDGALGLAVGDSRTCARTASEVLCDGRRSLSGAFDEIGIGGLTCGRARGSVTCTGWIDAPQVMAVGGLAHPDATATPAPFAELDDATAMVVGRAHVCALRASGRVACFSDSRSGGVGRVPAWVVLDPVAPEL